MENFPVFSLFIKEIVPGERFASDCVIHHTRTNIVQPRAEKGPLRPQFPGNARLRTALWMAAQTAIRMRENSFRRKFDNYVRGNPLDADLRRKAYTAIAAKLARVIFGLIKSGADYRPFFEHKFQVEEPSRASAVGATSTP